MNHVTTFEQIVLQAIMIPCVFSLSGMNDDKALVVPYTHHDRKKSEDAVRVEMKDVKPLQQATRILSFARQPIDPKKLWEEFFELDAETSTLQEALRARYSNSPSKLVTLAHVASRDQKLSIEQAALNAYQEIAIEHFGLWFRQDYARNRPTISQCDTDLIARLSSGPVCQYKYAQGYSFESCSWLGQHQLIAVVSDSDDAESRKIVTWNPKQRETGHIPVKPNERIIAGPYDKLFARISGSSVTISESVDNQIIQNKPMQGKKTYRVHDVSFSPDNTYAGISFVAADRQYYVDLYDLNTEQKMQQFGCGLHMAWDRTQKIALLTCSNTDTGHYTAHLVKEWVNNFSPIYSINSLCKPFLLDDGSKVIYQEGEHAIAIFDIQTKSVVDHVSIAHSVGRLYCNRQGTYLCITSPADQKICTMSLYDLATKKLLATHQIPRDSAIQFSADGNRVKVAADGKISFYEIPRNVTFSEKILLGYLAQHGMNKALDHISIDTIQLIIEKLW